MTPYEHPENILHAIEAIDDAIELTSDVNAVLENVIERVRYVFQCDRAWLFYPCNPNIAAFNVAYESTTPDYPGAKAMMADVPMTADMADYCRRALLNPGVPEWDPTGNLEMSNDIALRFNVQSLMFMALRPPMGDVWMIGLHQCDHRRVWSEQEKLLFRIIGSRITDCLSNVLYLGRLKEREERYYSLFEGSRDAIVLTDRHGAILDANPAAVALFGYPKDALLDVNFQKLYVNPREGARFQGEIRRKNLVQDFETRLRRNGGHEMDCLLSVVSRRDKNGRILEYQGIIRDVSEHKRSQEMLRASQQRLAQIIEFLPDATMVIDLDGEVMAWNHAMEQLTEVQAEEMLGKGNYEYALPFYGERRPVLIDLVFKWDGDLEQKYRYVRKQGAALVSETYDCLVKPSGTLWNMASLLYDDRGEVIGAIESIRDISEQRDAEKRLKSRNAYFEGLMDHMPDAMAVFDEAGTITEINARFVDMFGYLKEEAVGQNISELVGPPDRLEEAHAFRRRITSGESINVETVRRRKDGVLIDVSLRSAPVVVDNTEIGYLVIYTDISVRKQNEKERSQLRAQLRDAQKMEAIANLAGGIAHEFNNALMGIMGHIQLLKMDLPETERSRKSFKTIEVSGHRMSHLTDQLLAYAEGGKYKPKPLKMDDFLLQILPILKHELKPSVRVETHVDKEIPYMDADYTQLQMVLAAILTNANESIEADGLIRVSARKERVDAVSAEANPGLVTGSYVLLTVSDDGRGMDQETREGIFEPFFTTKFQGRGMGMAAVYGIVKNHGGWIYVDSVLGEGTTVRIYFPVKMPEGDTVQRICHERTDPENIG